MPPHDDATAATAPDKLRWKSRRGWLELDLLLAAFWQRHGASLSAEEEAMLAQWLEMDDEHLWALLASPNLPPQGAALAKKLRPAPASAD